MNDGDAKGLVVALWEAGRMVARCEHGGLD